MPDMTDPLDDRDATEHLIRAGREILAAARATIDSVDAFLAVLEERQASSRSPRENVQPIPIRRT